MSEDKRFVSQEEIDNFKKEYSNIEPIKVIDSNMFKFLSIKNIKDIKPKPIEYVLYPVLPTQGISIIYAASGIGKTLFTLNLAYAIAGGKNFLKYNSPKERKVLYVDGEMSFAQMHGRVSQIIEQSGNLKCDENLLILTPDEQDGIRLPKIDEKQGQFVYKEMIEKKDIEVIIFDNLSMLSSLDENKSNEWISIQDWFLSLRAMGKTVILVHHSGKEQNGYRGTSRMLDAVDTAISLQAVNNDCLEDENLTVKKIKVVYQKNRGFSGKDALPFEVNFEFGKWSYKSNEQTEIDLVVEKLKAGMSQRDIAKELNCSQSKIFKLKEKAIKDGLITPIKK